MRWGDRVAVESLDMYTEQMVYKTDKFWTVVMGVLPWLEWTIYCMSLCKRCV